MKKTFGSGSSKLSHYQTFKVINRVSIKTIPKGAVIGSVEIDEADLKKLETWLSAERLNEDYKQSIKPEWPK
jgi:hypothetical protein